MSDEPEVDLDELAVWCRAATAEPSRRVQLTPADLQRQPWRLTWNAACSALEALGSRGDLARLPGPTLAWRPTTPTTKPGKGYALPLTPKEHAALLRGLDALLAASERDRLYHGGIASSLKREKPEPESEDAKTLRALRSRLKRPT